MTISALYVCPAHNFFGHHGRPPGQDPMVPVPRVECVPGRGLRGDRFFDFKQDYKGQVTFFAAETHERLCAALAVRDRGPEVFRRNIITRGADLNALKGSEFEVQGIRFFGTEESAPCHWMNTAFAEGAENLLRGHGGLRARILTAGFLEVEGS